MIKLEDISKVYSAEPVSTVALQHIDLVIKQGELVAITGPSGCGKSSLLNILGMIDMPDSGNYYFDGRLVSGISEKDRADIRKRHVGFVFQSFNLIGELTIYENVELPLLYMKVSAAERKDRVLSLLDAMKIAHRSRHYPSQLSGGQQQRVAVARAMANSPKLILADEPTGNLDTKNGDEVMKQLMGLNEQGVTVVIVTHSLHYAQFCNRTIRLLDGRILAEEMSPASYV